MTELDVQGCLQEAGWTARLPGPVVEKLARLARVRTAGVQEVLFREGTENHEFGVVVSGRVGLDMGVPGRGRVRLLTVGPGEMLGWSALVGQGRMTTSAVALEPSRLLVFSGPDLVAACAADPAVGCAVYQRVAEAISSRLLATRLQLLDLFARDVPALPGERQ